MSIVTSIIDALRKFGSELQRSAIRRQDEQLEARTVVERRRNVARSELGYAEGFVASVLPEPATVTPIESSLLEEIAKNALLVDGFIKAFLGGSVRGSFLDDLDNSFAAWLEASDKLGYASGDVIEIAGAAFGQFCIEQLDMRWVRITDQCGDALAIQGRVKDFRGFPFNSIAKRIDAGEHGFFKSIYISLQDVAQSDCSAIPH